MAGERGRYRVLSPRKREEEKGQLSLKRPQPQSQQPVMVFNAEYVSVYRFWEEGVCTCIFKGWGGLETSSLMAGPLALKDSAF